MSARSEEYRRKAKEAEDSARTTCDLAAKRKFEQLADHYRYLADQQEQMDRRTPLGRAGRF